MNFPLYRYIEVCLLSLSPFSMIYIPCWHIARLVIFPHSIWWIETIQWLASYLLNSGAFISIADAEYVIAVTYIKYFAAATAFGILS